MKTTPDLRVALYPTCRYCLSLGVQWYPIQVVGTPGCGRQNPATCSPCDLYHQEKEPVLTALTVTHEKTEANKALCQPPPGTDLSVQKHRHPEDHLSTEP